MLRASLLKFSAAVRARARELAVGFDDALTTRPRVTKALTAAAIAAAGDVLCQLATAGRAHADGASESAAAAAAAAAPAGSAGLDLGRTAQLAAFQLLMAPCVHEWYGLLAAHAPSPLAMTVFDQAVFAPLGTALFLGYLALSSGFKAPGEYVLDKIGPILFVNWAVWPAVQYVNFKYTPLRYRVVVVSIVSFCESRQREWGVRVCVRVCASRITCEPARARVPVRTCFAEAVGVDGGRSALLCAHKTALGLLGAGSSARGALGGHCRASSSAMRISALVCAMALARATLTRLAQPPSLSQSGART